MVLANESIFFTDSSKKFPRTEVIFDVAEGRGNGQLLHYDPVMNMTHVVLDEVPFPNGMVLSHDKTALLFTETSRARIMRSLTHSSLHSHNVYPFLVYKFASVPN